MSRGQFAWQSTRGHTENLAILYPRPDVWIRASGRGKNIWSLRRHFCVKQGMPHEGNYHCELTSWPAPATCRLVCIVSAVKTPQNNNSKNRFQERRNVRYLLLRISIHWSFGSNWNVGCWISLWWLVYNNNLVYNTPCILKGYLLSLLSLNFFRECLNFP